MSSNSKETIFISVASYRDPVCSVTLNSIYDNAAKPENVFVGICQQNKEGDEDCLNTIDKNKKISKDNIRIMRVGYKEAKGPTYARYLCSTLYKDEEYFMQIDSHSKFVPNWDTKCINMIKKLKDEHKVKKPLLSHYPNEINMHKDYDEKDENKRNNPPRICKSFFNNRDMISFAGAEIINTKNNFYQTPFVSGGMFFAEAKFLKEVPYDPHLPYLFVGEEILHSARFYTNGWDSYTPTENILYHEYTRSDKPKYWTDIKNYSDSKAFEKVKFLLKFNNDESKVHKDVKKDIEKYSLGKERTLEQYYEFAGIDIKDRLVRKNFCRKDNKATEEDIKNSNEKNKKIEKFILSQPGSVNFYVEIIMIILIIIIIILIILFFIKNMKQKDKRIKNRK